MSVRDATEPSDFSQQPQVSTVLTNCAGLEPLSLPDHLKDAMGERQSAGRRSCRDRKPTAKAAEAAQAALAWESTPQTISSGSTTTSIIKPQEGEQVSAMKPASRNSLTMVFARKKTGWEIYELKPPDSPFQGPSAASIGVAPGKKPITKISFKARIKSESLPIASTHPSSGTTHSEIVDTIIPTSGADLTQYSDIKPCSSGGYASDTTTAEDAKPNVPIAEVNAARDPKKQWREKKASASKVKAEKPASKSASEPASKFTPSELARTATRVSPRSRNGTKKPETDEARRARLLGEQDTAALKRWEEAKAMERKWDVCKATERYGFEYFPTCDWLRNHPDGAEKVINYYHETGELLKFPRFYAEPLFDAVSVGEFYFGSLGETSKPSPDTYEYHMAYVFIPHVGEVLCERADLSGARDQYERLQNSGVTTLEQDAAALRRFDLADKYWELKGVVKGQVMYEYFAYVEENRAAATLCQLSQQQENSQAEFPTRSESEMEAAHALLDLHRGSAFSPESRQESEAALGLVNFSRAAFLEEQARARAEKRSHHLRVSLIKDGPLSNA